jgi:hypothetical protein
MSYATRVLKDNWMNFSVYRHRAFDGFLVTSKNSGTHWVKYMLAIALADTHGIERPKYFSEEAVRPYIGWPKDSISLLQLPRLAFSHTIPHRLVDWGIVRRLAKLPPYVLCVRHPMSILASHHAKWEYDIKVDWLEYLRGDSNGSRYRCDLFWLARFWNRWGKFEAASPDSILRVQYEATRVDPKGILESIGRHWGYNLKPEAIDAAVAAGTKKAMALKVDPNAEPNVLQNRKQSLAELFSGEAMEIYAARVRELFRYDLGYDLMNPPND